MNGHNIFLLISFMVVMNKVIIQLWCLALLISSSVLSQPAAIPTSDKSDGYVCLPCGSDCDKMSYSSAGTCGQCQMKLVRRSTIVFGTIEPQKICSFIASHPTVVLLDVRTRAEFEGKAEPDFGGLKNAINIPIQEFDRRIQELAAFKEKEIIVFCSHSRRSPQASYLLTQNGFSKVFNMAGGMSVMTDGDCKR